MVIYLVRPYGPEKRTQGTKQHWQAWACIASDGRVWTAIGPTPDDAMYSLMADVSFQTVVEVKG